MGVLENPLTHRLDNLYVVTPSDSEFRHARYFRLIDQPLKRELEVLFGEPDIFRHGGYHFVEPPKGYDGPSHMLQLCRHNNTYYGRNFAGGVDLFQAAQKRRQQRFMDWLYRRRAELLAHLFLADMHELLPDVLPLM
jgi:hypothetical protein